MLEKERNPGAKKAKLEQPCLVLLGRAGDIINSLPIARHYSNQFGRPTPFVVAKQFAGILECTSYCEPIPWDGELYMTINEAVAWSKQRYPNVLPLQTAGHNFPVHVETPSYCDEHYRFGGMTGERGKHPLIFDRRSKEREAKLLARHRSKLPIILYSFRGLSSPFKNAVLMLQELSAFSGVATLINTDTCGSECIVDLLALYEKAKLLVTIDTATMHLAAASTVPYIGFTVDFKPGWHTTPPLGNIRLNVPYSKTVESLPQIRNLIESIIMAAQPRIEIAPKPSDRKIIHITDSHWLTETRCQTAVASWAVHYRKGMKAAHLPTAIKRDARDIGSKRPLPFLKDVLRHGLDSAADDDFVLWTNSDTILGPDFVSQLSAKLDKAKIVVGRRVDFATDKVHPGRDIAAFSAKWLKSNWSDIPDFVCGAAEIDVWMALVARDQAGIKVKCAADLMWDEPAVDLPPGQVKHIDHEAPWDLPEARYSEPSNIHNVQCLRGWCKIHQPAVMFTPKGFVDWNSGVQRTSLVKPICFATLAFGPIKPVWEFAAKTWQPYCKERGFELIVETELPSPHLAPSWNKCLIVAHLLRERKTPVWWIDADMTLANPKFELERQREWNEITVSRDWNGYCFGMFRAEPTSWAIGFLEFLPLLGDVGKPDQFGKGMGCKWEQNAIKLIAAGFPEVKRRIGTLPESWVNENPQKPKLEDVIWHFGARGMELRLAMMKSKYPNL